MKKMIEPEMFEKMREDKALRSNAQKLFNDLCEYKYSYHFSCLGRPIIQFPQDMVAVQELIWDVKPDLIIETGVAHGGSLVLSASMLALLDYCESIQTGRALHHNQTRRKVIGIDIDIRSHNRIAIESHPLSHLITLIQGSSIDSAIVSKVKDIAAGYKKILVFLDSNHTHSHVLEELRSYAPLVSAESYCVVFDTVIENMPENAFPDRGWGRGNNPLTAIHEFLNESDDFEIDSAISDRLVLSVAPSGFLRKKVSA